MFLSNGRPHASYRTLWKEGECGVLSVLNVFLGTTCERPSQTVRCTKAIRQRHKYKSKQGAKYVNISLNFFSKLFIFDISSHRLQFTRRTFPVTDVT